MTKFYSCIQLALSISFVSLILAIFISNHSILDIYGSSQSTGVFNPTNSMSISSSLQVTTNKMDNYNQQQKQDEQQLKLQESAKYSTRSPLLHEIKMGAVELPDGHTAYKMLEYKIIDKQNNSTNDITSRYSDLPTIPGPTIIMTEGDVAKLTLINEIGRGTVSLHTHGVHYEITSDGTLKPINKITDQAATPEKSFTYVWTAAEGTRGSWPWHDHTFGKGPSASNMNGVETTGFFSSVIVNPANGKVNALVDGLPKAVDVKDIKKDFVLFISDDAFWGVEIDNTNNGKQTPLWVNPTLVVSKDDLVRFHIQSVGTDFHKFGVDNYKWLKPGTNITTSLEKIGPLENHVFTINADKSTSYYDKMPIHYLSGMKGKFEVISNGTSTNSIAGPAPTQIGDTTSEYNY